MNATVMPVPKTVRKIPVKREEAMGSTLRSLAVLELLAQEPFEFGLSEICGRLQLPKGSAHRVTATLLKAGFVEQDVNSRCYRLTGKALWVGTGFLRHSRVYHSCFSALQDLAEKAKGMVHLAVWDNDSVLYLHTVGQPSSLYLFADTGERRPVHATALGKAMLAFRPAEDVDRIFSAEVERFTAKTITSVKAMRAELKMVAEQGYAFDDEEGVRGLRCLAAPIRDRMGQVVAAMSMSGPANLVTDETRPEIASMVQEAAIRASVQMGYRPRTSNVSSLLTSLRQPNRATKAK